MRAMSEAARPDVLFTVEDYFTLVERGLLAPDDPVELLEGVVVEKSPQSAGHASGISLVAEVLRLAFVATATEVIVRVQLPLLLGISAPAPDIAVVAGRARDFFQAHPSSALMIVEVADSSLAQDRLSKQAISAAAGVPEFWILNLRGGVLEVYRSPESRVYRDHLTLKAADEVTPLAAPGATIAVAELLPI